MSVLFESVSINRLELKNRFVRSATWEGMADEKGACTSQLIQYMRQLALGEVGLIVSGHSYVLPAGQASFRQLGVYEDRLVPGLSDMAAAVHEAGGKMILQLAHAGCHANVDLTGAEPLGPSPLTGKSGAACREMTRSEISETVEAFGLAAERAQKAGFDGVQLHAAHGYFLSQFLSPFYNRRTDPYGGSLENRARIVIDTYHRVRETVGPDYPVLIKINSEDFVQGEGFTVSEMIQVSRWLEEAGLDAVEMSGGTQNSPAKLNPVRLGKIKTAADEVYYREAARAFKAQVGLPLILVGGIRSYEVAEALVQSGEADFIALSRPLIREPQLIKRWKSGDTARAACRSDNLCFRPAVEGKGLFCVVEAREADKASESSSASEKR
ncbi:MAG: NADH:flavin oxidoreductase [Desulfococcaceae bacterium]